MLRLALPLALSCLFACAHGKGLSREEAQARFSKLVTDYFDEAFAFEPTAGTVNGFHQYDPKLEDFSAARVATHVQKLQDRLDRAVALWTERVALPYDDLIDLEALESRIRADLLEWEKMGFRLQNPMTYSRIPGEGIDALLKRDFAPAPERLKSITARLRAVPAVYAAGKANVKTPPKEWTDLALRMANGTLGFLQDSVAPWGKQAAGADILALADFNRASTTAYAATQDWIHFLEKQLKPRSTGSWAIGPAFFTEKLQTEDMISEPLDALLAKGEAQLKADREAAVQTAQLIDRRKTVAQVVEAMQSDHPSAKDLIPAVGRSLEGVRQFVVSKNLVSFPSEVRPKVEPTPPYARNGSFASLDAPGPYETKATESYYYVTPAEDTWSPAQVEEHLRAFSTPVLAITDVHEAYPGHFLQALWMPKVPTKVRKLLVAASNVEGWAHYTEQMVVEEGFADTDPRIKLAQLEEALLRDCRFVVGIQLHTTTLTVEQGAERFVKECFQAPANAYEEARRGTYDPTYLVYTYGKMQIYELRREYLSQKGGTLREFHDAFLAQGGVPIRLVRKLLFEQR
ncbi:MAG: DUF885 domain-containing protein [Myxococcaceae bacterium]|nr:MAG: DUF885 domain-containing protein [Myxococcaceae bacterium]